MPFCSCLVVQAQVVMLLLFLLNPVCLLWFSSFIFSWACQMLSFELPFGPYMIRTCKCLYHTWEACLCTPLALHGMIWVGAASQGEVHSRGSDLHECFVTHLMSPIVNKGEKLYDSSSFAYSVLRGAFSKGEKFLGWVVWDLKFLLVTGGAECALIWLSVAYCEGKLLGYGVRVVSVLSEHFASSGFWAFVCSCTGCVEPLPLSGGTGVLLLHDCVEPCLCLWGVMLSLISCVELFPLS
jgi:hypothetical protein